VISRLSPPFSNLLHAVKQSLRSLVKPANYSLAANVMADLTRSKTELILENAFLRQQLIILDRQVKRPLARPRERVLLVALASRLRSWKQALLIVQPATLVRWHQDLFRWLWKRLSRPSKRMGRPPLLNGLVDLIQWMARENRTWGAERIRGELLKLGIRVAKSTTLKYIRLVRQPTTSDQTWLTFLHNHAPEIWACDFLQTFGLFFRALFVFVIIELDSRRVVHVAVTRHPTDAWVAQQLREATPFGVKPRFLIRDRDRKFGEAFGRVVKGTSIDVLLTPYHTPQANAICERFWGSMRRECLDFFILLGERHLYRVVREYVQYFNNARPHQGIGQQIPTEPEPSVGDGEVLAFPVLGGLHHDYHRAARWFALPSGNRQAIPARMARSDSLTLDFQARLWERLPVAGDPDARWSSCRQLLARKQDRILSKVERMYIFVHYRGNTQAARRARLWLLLHLSTWSDEEAA
jgi:putative transposase